MIIVFTGNGKGKTTAALGQAIRAIGNGSKVLMVEFIKGPWKSGEDAFAKKISQDLKIVKKGKGFVRIMNNTVPFEEHVSAAHDALYYASREVQEKKWNILILDEVWVALSLKLITMAEVLSCIDAAEKCCDHIILTGRGCPKEFFDRADLVTEMKEIKHPFSSGSPGTKGVEY
ncbi:MAG: cob(I)yrinic acid a,c-diamide adenosyltransferase [Candidatus Paceibacterota bacterium]|jgi:cob(I)alamin adenosyltransferase